MGAGFLMWCHRLAGVVVSTPVLSNPMLYSPLNFADLSSATQELNGLLALEYQMARNLEALRQQRAEVKFSQTIQGKLFNIGGRIFALYCVYRIVVVSDMAQSLQLGLTRRNSPLSTSFFQFSR